MLPDSLTFGFVTLRTYTVLLMLALCAGLSIGWLRLRRWQTIPPGHWVDVVLASLVGGVLLARCEHVVLHWDYFADHLDEALRLNAGGLGWHGGFVGGLIGLHVAARWRRLAVPPLLTALAPLPPLIALGGWLGCSQAACGYGAEVDTLARYPAAIVIEARDVFGIVAPRWNTALFGVLLAAGVLMFALLKTKRDFVTDKTQTRALWLSALDANTLRQKTLPSLRPARFKLLSVFSMASVVQLSFSPFWRGVLLLSLGMFAIGFLRADAMWRLAGLRADQWLDLGVAVVALGAIRIASGRE